VEFLGDCGGATGPWRRGSQGGEDTGGSCVNSGGQSGIAWPAGT